jgi:hypothetical protein
MAYLYYELCWLGAPKRPKRDALGSGGKQDMATSQICDLDQGSTSDICLCGMSNPSKARMLDQ